MNFKRDFLEKQQDELVNYLQSKGSGLFGLTMTEF